MSREGQLMKNTLIITFGKICTQFLSFFLLPLYTSLLTTEEYGIVDVEEFVKNLPEKKEIFLSEDIFIQIQSKIYQRCITCPRII